MATGESALNPPFFHGQLGEDAESFVRAFDHWRKYRGLEDNRALEAFPLFLKDGASLWFATQQPGNINTLAALKERFKIRYTVSDRDKWKRAARLWTLKQAPVQTADDFITAVEKAASEIEADEAQTVMVVINGLKPAIRQHIF